MLIRGICLAVLALAISVAVLPFCAEDARPARPFTTREQILEAMQQVMGPLPSKPSTPPEIEVLEEIRLDKFTRRKITFTSGDGDRVPAYLFLPDGKGKRPAVLCLHQTTAIGKGEPAGLGGKPNLHYGRELAERGYVVLAPDYPNFGDYRIDPYAMGYASASMKGIANHRRAIDVLHSMAEVEAGRIGVAGHSLGGHNSLFLAAFDIRVAAVVTSCGFTSFARYMGGDLTGWTHKGYMPRIALVYGKSPARMPFEFADVLAAIATRPVFVNAPLHDENFNVTGVDDAVREAHGLAQRLYGRDARIVVEHPDCAHDFPPDVRERAYEFLDRWLQ